MADQGSEAARRLPVVLLVDDEPLLLGVVDQELREVFELHTAGSAAEAERHVAARRFDAIVCDHMLPGEQGLDFLIRMMEKFPSTRRILMTGYTNTEFISRSTVIGGLSACLVKPLRASEIANAVRTALAR
ncbi:MAG TPA: response regulator [Opitutaceae bacterium]|nr:response regulator [Opitutaceae bacterium]